MIEFERQKPLNNTLSIAPLIDIIFLLLLFFMLTSVFIEPGIPLDLPKSTTAEFQPRQAEIVIYITKLGEIYVDHEFIAFDGLYSALSAMFQGKTEKSVTLKADKDVPFGLFVRVMDVAKEAGGEHLIISAELP